MEGPCSGSTTVGEQQRGNTALGKVFREPGTKGHQWVGFFGEELLIFYLFASESFFVCMEVSS